jgi:methylphosphotriester-DNA--protein-cysteine methyltransferase
MARTESHAEATPDALDQARALLDAKRPRLLRLGDLARSEAYRPATCSAVFRARFGVSPAEYIASKKLDASSGRCAKVPM